LGDFVIFRLLSNLLLTGAVGAFGFSGGLLALTVLAPPGQPFEPPQLAGTATASHATARTLEAVWPAIFGVEVVPEPEPTPEPVAAVAPEPEPDPEPEIRYDYMLAGLVADERGGWAMVSAGGMAELVRPGDTLEGGETITRIDPQGVWIMLGDIPQVIPVNKSDFSELVWRTAPAEAPPIESREEVRVSVERMDRNFIERALVDAGRLVRTELEDGSSGLDVVWIRRGELYDQMGLRTGDMILRIDGEEAGDQDMHVRAPGALSGGGSIDLEIMRNGARQKIKVSLDQS